jgi:hypothetical protein
MNYGSTGEERMSIRSMTVLLGLMVPGLMVADTFNYLLTINGFDPTTETQTANTFTVNFSTSPVPEEFNAPPNFLQSFSVTGTPAPGWTLSTITGLSATSTVNGDGDVLVGFKDGADTVQYELFGSDSFWATPGLQTFGSTNDTTQNSGAFFTFADGTEVGCVGCTVLMTVTTPEPESIALLATAVLLSLMVFRRQQRARCGV